MTSSDTHLAVFSLWTGLASALAVCASALFYLRRVRLQRPAIGTFNGRDIVVIFGLLSTIPVLYLTLPRWLLTGFLVLTFSASLSIGLRPVLSPGRLWLLVGTLIGLNLWLAHAVLGTLLGWKVFWAETDVIVLLAAVSVANLYIQGGMRLQHVAWFALALAGYDVVFTQLVPVTNALVEEFLGYPLDPSIGMRWGFDNAAVGLGDLLVYAMFVLGAHKGYGRAAGRVALGVVLAFGAVVPALVPLLVSFVDARTDTLVPAQSWFGPAAFVTYLLMRRRYGRERTMGEFWADPAEPAPAAPAEPADRPARPAVPAPALTGAGGPQ